MARPCKKSDDGYFRAAFACELEDLALLNKMLDEGLDTAHAPRDRPTLLQVCCTEKFLPALDLLLARGAKANLEEVEWLNPSVMAVLLKHGANPNHADAEGWSLLHTACSFKSEALALLLLDHGADPEALDRQAWSAWDVCNCQDPALGQRLLAHVQAKALTTLTPQSPESRTRRI